MQQISTFERARAFAEPAETAGRPTLCSEEVAKKIVENLAAGSYLITACEAAGVSYASVRGWLRRAAEDKEKGNLESPYFKFSRILSHAEAAAEQALVQRLNIAEDWRAQAFLLERRHRDRWGKTEQQQQPQQVLVISEDLAAGMLEALKAAAAPQQQQQAIDTTAEGWLIMLRILVGT